MRQIHALSMTSAVVTWLANTRQPRILHIFDRACNLINEQNEVLSLVAAEIGNGPFNLVLETDVFFAESLSLESPISNSADQLTLGDLTIHIADAKLWNPQPDWELLHSRKDDLAVQVAKLSIFTEPSLEVVSQFSNSLVSNLSSAFLNTEISTAKETASKLAGLGIGLTPSGDDFLMGALYAAWIIHPHEIAQVLAGEVAKVAAPLTTSLSAAWLRTAGQGEAGGVWHEFFEALISGKMQSIQMAVNQILAVGETSGADALSGFISVFNEYQKKELATYENSSR